MLNGFERQTKGLSEYEKQRLVPIVVKGMRYHYGKSRAVTAKHICDQLTAQGYEINDARLRKVIKYIRHKGLIPGIIVASSRGYYVSDNMSEIQRYIRTLEGRAQAILAVRDRLLNQLENR